MEFNPSEVILLLLATLGPLKVTIVCATLTADASPEFLKRVAFRSVLIAFAVCLLFAVLGEAILKIFKVSIPAFQIGGGIVVLLFSLEMAMGSPQEGKAGARRPEENPAEPSLEIATYPLAIPLMASVSGLVAIVSLLAQRDDIGAILYLAGVIAAIMAINYLCLRSCKYIVRAMGSTVLQVVGRIMGVILVSLAVELILMGLLGLGLIAKPVVRSSTSTPSSTAEAAEVPELTIQRLSSHPANSTGGTPPINPINPVGSSSSGLEPGHMQSSASEVNCFESGAVERWAHGLAAFPSRDQERDGCPLWPGSSMDGVEV